MKVFIDNVIHIYVGIVPFIIAPGRAPVCHCHANRTQHQQLKTFKQIKSNQIKSNQIKSTNKTKWVDLQATVSFL